jgi:hypothetical protein
MRRTSAPSHKGKHLDVADTPNRLWKIDNGVVDILEDILQFADIQVSQLHGCMDMA